MPVSYPVTALRRYPVKAMGGESLERVDVDARGFSGDRWYAVVDDGGQLASGKSTRRFRRRDRVFDYRAVTGDAGEVTVTGPGGSWRVGDPALDQQLSAAMEAHVRVLPERGVRHQDGGEVSLVGSASLAWCADRWGIDADTRRLRVNLVLDTDVPFVEESWVGRTLQMGSARLRVVEPVPRCRTVDLEQDGARAHGRWLRRLAAERDMCLAVYADVVTPGAIALGDQAVG